MNNHMEYWNQLAAQYDELYQDNWSQLEDRLTATWMRPYIQPTDHVLDVGCGTGLLLDMHPIAPTQYIGIDYAEAMIDRARLKYPKHQFMVRFADDLPCARDSQDCVIALNGVYSYHYPLGDAIRDARRVLRENGTLIFQIYNRQSLYNRFYTPKHAEVLPSRGNGNGGVTHYFYHPDFIRNALPVWGFEIVSIATYSAFGRIAQHAPLWFIDRALCKAFSVGYTMTVIARKYGKNL